MPTDLRLRVGRRALAGGPDRPDRRRPAAPRPPDRGAVAAESAAVSRLHDEERDGSGGERRRLVGTPAQVRADIEETVAAYGAEEVIVVTITHDHQARCRSYELLAEEFGQAPKGG